VGFVNTDTQANNPGGGLFPFFFSKADSGAATGPELAPQQALARRVPSVFILTHGY